MQVCPPNFAIPYDHALFFPIHLTEEKSEMQKSSVIFLNNTNQTLRFCGNLVQIYYFLLLLCYFKLGHIC